MGWCAEARWMSRKLKYGSMAWAIKLALKGFSSTRWWVVCEQWRLAKWLCCKSDFAQKRLFNNEIFKANLYSHVVLMIFWWIRKEMEKKSLDETEKNYLSDDLSHQIYFASKLKIKINWKIIASIERIVSNL